MNKFMYLIIPLIILTGGYAYSSESKKASLADLSQFEQENEQNHITNQTFINLLEEYTFSMAIEDGYAVWSHREVHNLKKLDDFVDHVKQQKQDTLRIVSSTKEGGIMVKDLTYNGEFIELTMDLTRAPDLTKDGGKRNRLSK